MKNVLHIGAADGEIDFYSSLGVSKLVYAEPDKKCLRSLSMSIREFLKCGSIMEVWLVPKACSSNSGEQLSFHANGLGQSSIEVPGSRTLSIVGNNFEEYSVESISLVDLKESTFGNNRIDYCCIDTQGHEKAILCGVDPEYLQANFMVIDVELMTDTSQYSVPEDNWQEVVLHLLKSGFEPLVHPHGITESYIFINSSLNTSYLTSMAAAIRDQLMQDFFSRIDISIEREKCSSFSSLGNHMFLPFTHIGGAIHATLLQPFREKFIAAYLSSLTSELDK